MPEVTVSKSNFRIRYKNSDFLFYPGNTSDARFSNCRIFVVGQDLTSGLSVVYPYTYVYHVNRKPFSQASVGLDVRLLYSKYICLLPKKPTYRLSEGQLLYVEE